MFLAAFAFSNMPQYKTTVADLRVRVSPDGAVIGNIKAPGTVIDVVRVDGKWALLTAAAGGATLSAGRLGRGEAWVSSEFIASVDVTPPPATNTPYLMTGAHPALPLLPNGRRIGVHVFNNTQAAWRWFKSGCRLFTVMDNVLLMRELRAAGAVVYYRSFQFHGSRWSARQHIDKAGLSRDDKCVFLGLNERDAGFSSIADRAKWDRDFADIMIGEYPNVIPALCGEAMGNPERVEDPGVQAEMRRAYAWLNDAKYKDRVVWNYHSYERRPAPEFPGTNNTAVVGTDWYAMRHYKFLYDTGVLPPWLVFVSDESGIDVMGTGGVSAMQYSQDDVRRLNAHRDATLLARPQTYGVTDFCGTRVDERPEWGGYSVEFARDAYAERWRA